MKHFFRHRSLTKRRYTKVKFTIIICSCSESRVSNDETNLGSPNSLVGTWKFISLYGKSSNGDKLHPYSENPFGRLMYDANRNMSFLIMSPDRPKFASGDILKGTPEEIKAAFEGFDAYCGTYTINLEKETVTHHLQGSRFPNWIGTNQVRFFKISGDTLRISALPIVAGGVQWDFKAILVNYKWTPL